MFFYREIIVLCVNQSLTFIDIFRINLKINEENLVKILLKVLLPINFL